MIPQADKPTTPQSYPYWRERGLPASIALAKAREDAAANKQRYSTSGDASYQNSPSERSGRWIEDPSAAGLRFVGWSDELSGIDHFGWYLNDDDQDEVARGCVYQLPARNGRPIYIEAIRVGSTGRNRRSWSDQSSGRDSGCAIVYLNENHEGKPGYTDNEKAKRDAAHGADEEARIYGEHEREYQRAWQAGSRAADLLEHIKDDSSTIKGLVAELRQLKTIVPVQSAPLACQTLRATIKTLASNIRQARARIEKLRDEYSGNDAFADGFGG